MFRFKCLDVVFYLCFPKFVCAIRRLCIFARAMIPYQEHTYTCIAAWLGTRQLHKQQCQPSWSLCSEARACIERAAAVGASDPLYDWCVRDQRCPFSPLTNSPMYSNSVSRPPLLTPTNTHIYTNTNPVYSRRTPLQRRPQPLFPT